MYRYRAHGLSVHSEFDLPLPFDPEDSSDPDLVLRAGHPRPVPPGDAPGRVLASLRDDHGTVFYSLGLDHDRAVLRYPGMCEFVGDADLRRVEVHLHPGYDPGIVAVLAGGSVLAVHLKLSGALVLHASAVQVGGRAVAFVGAAGMGKSTMATLFDAYGYPLVSDDLLRADLGPTTGVRVHSGSTESRLRPGSAQLADDAASDAVRRTADGRLALRSRFDADTAMELAACVIPLPRRDTTAVTVTRLGPARALMRMAQFPRLVGWTEPLTIARDFQALADLVQVVPVYEARIPWGLPFAADLPDRILAGIETHLWDRVTPAVDAATTE